MSRPALRTTVSVGLALLIAGCADPVAPRAASPDAVAGPDLAKGSGGADVVRFDVTFTIPSGTCGLRTTVTGTGVYQVVTRESRGPTGELRVAITETSHGTATGADGSRYRFNYAANYGVVEVLDPSGLPIVIDLVDHFNLLGQAGAPDVKVFLKGQFLYDGSAPVTPIGDPVIRGDVTCDPL